MAKPGDSRNQVAPLPHSADLLDFARSARAAQRSVTPLGNCASCQGTPLKKGGSKPDELDDSGSANKDRQAADLLKVCCHSHRTKLKTKTAKTLKSQRYLSLTMALAQGFMLLPHILIRA